MKVIEGIVVISNRNQTLNKFFLASPFLAMISSECKTMDTCKPRDRNVHHELNVKPSAKENRCDFGCKICVLHKSFQQEGGSLVSLQKKSRCTRQGDTG